MKNGVPPNSSIEEDGRNDRERRGRNGRIDRSVVVSADESMEESTLNSNTISLPSSPASSGTRRGNLDGSHCDSPMEEGSSADRGFVTLQDGYWLQSASMSFPTSAHIGAGTTAATLFLDDYGFSNEDADEDTDEDADEDEVIDALNKAIEISDEILPPGDEPNWGTLCRD